MSDETIIIEKLRKEVRRLREQAAALMAERDRAWEMQALLHRRAQTAESKRDQDVRIRYVAALNAANVGNKRLVVSADYWAAEAFKLRKENKELKRVVANAAAE